MVKVWTAATAVLLFVGHLPALAQTDTGQAMTARRAREVIRLRVTPDNKSIEVALDSKENFAPLKKDQTFITTGPVAVTIERPNPLTLLVTADVTEADDPDYATVGKLIEAMLTATNIIRPGATGGAGPEGVLRDRIGVEAFVRDPSPECRAALTAANAAVATLDSTLFSDAWSKKTIGHEIKSWTAAIDRGHRELKPGPAAIQAGVDAIQQYLDRSFGSPGRKPGDLVKDAATAVQSALEAHAPTNLNPECTAAINTIYGLVRLTNPQSRLADINKIFASITDLKATLEKNYANPANWYGPDTRKTGFYLRRAVEPSSQKMQVVSIKALSVDYSGLDTVTPVLLAKREDLVAASFTVKQYSWFVPEVGVGATFMTFDRPKYATTKNAAGETVVGESFDDLTVEPTVMLNFVLRQLPGAVVTPMAQIGVSTSKETPTFFVGGGIRFLHTGKGDFAVGLGWAFPWVRQLRELNVGDPVPGTKEIEDDLEFQTFGTHRYFVLQYKF